MLVVQHIVTPRLLAEAENHLKNTPIKNTLIKTDCPSRETLQYVSDWPQRTGGSDHTYLTLHSSCFLTACISQPEGHHVDPLTHASLTLGVLLCPGGGGEVFRDRHGFIPFIWSVTDRGALLPCRHKSELEFPAGIVSCRESLSAWASPGWQERAAWRGASALHYCFPVRTNMDFSF